MARKTALKNAVQLEKQRSDIFLFWGYPYALQNAGFGKSGKSKGTLKKMKWHIKLKEKMPFN